MDQTNLLSTIKTIVILAFLISGSFFMIKAVAIPSITGSVVGAQAASNSILVGITSFLIALALAFHKDNELKKHINK